MTKAKLYFTDSDPQEINELEITNLAATGNGYISGNVGVGTTNPTHKLHVVGDARITGILTVGTNTITINENSGVTVEYTNLNQFFAGQNLVNAPFYNTFTQTSSQYQAIVKGRCTGSSTTDIMSFGNIHNTDGTQNIAFHRIRSDGTNSVAYTLSGSGGSIWHSGNDGSGSGLDADLLDGLNESTFFRRSVDTWNTSADGQARLYFATNNRSYYRSADGHEFRSSTDTNIGELNNSGEMYIAQVYNGRGFRCRTGVNGTNGNVFNINWTGSAAQLWIDTTNIGTFISDYRVKKNIKPIEDNALDRIKQLRPVKYERRDYKIFKEDGLIREGFIAQEVGEVIPSGVQGEKDDEKEIQSLNLDAIVAVLTKAVQEQQKIIENQQKQIDELKNQIELLKK